MTNSKAVAFGCTLVTFHVYLLFSSLILFAVLSLYPCNGLQCGKICKWQLNTNQVNGAFCARRLGSLASTTGTATQRHKLRI